jgi:hypothetical protein
VEVVPVFESALLAFAVVGDVFVGASCAVLVEFPEYLCGMNTSLGPVVGRSEWIVGYSYKASDRPRRVRLSGGAPEKRRSGKSNWRLLPFG